MRGEERVRANDVENKRESRVNEAECKYSCILEYLIIHSVCSSEFALVFVRVVASNLVRSFVQPVSLHHEFSSTAIIVAHHAQKLRVTSQQLG